MNSTVIPCLLYRDAPAAIEWICETLGGDRHLVVHGEDGVIEHAQLRLGTGMLMLGSVRDNEHQRHLAQPDEFDGRVTQSIYLVSSDTEDLYDWVSRSDAEVVAPLKDEDYGGQSFTFRDMEGHLWTIGSYDPWAEEAGEN